VKRLGKVCCRLDLLCEDGLSRRESEDFIAGLLYSSV
jgi:hypothetical protein